jgi:hypothetical protein
MEINSALIRMLHKIHHFEFCCNILIKIGLSERFIKFRVLICHWPRLVCNVLMNSDTLTVNYGVKQNQFTKSTSEPPR